MPLELIKTVSNVDSSTCAEFLKKVVIEGLIP
jgi:hypothetical protein